MSQQSNPPAVRKEPWELSTQAYLRMLRRLMAAETKVSLAEDRCLRLEKLCPMPDRCRDRSCRRRKGCRKVAAATVKLVAARARLAAASGS